MGTDLIVPGADSQYAVLAMPQAEITDLIQSNLSPGESIGFKDLPRIKIPGAGGTTWEIPSHEGPRADRELTGVIIRKETRRAYYVEEYNGGNDRPDCASNDGILGIANEESGHPGPGGSCQACPFNEFGSHVKGVAKACTEYRQLFILPPDGLLPFVLNISPGSLAMARAYFFGLLNARMTSLDCETVLTLTKVKGANAEFAQVNFRTGARLDPAAKARISAYSALITPQMDEVAREEVSREDVAAEAA